MEPGLRKIIAFKLVISQMKELIITDNKNDFIKLVKSLPYEITSFEGIENYITQSFLNLSTNIPGHCVLYGQVSIFKELYEHIIIIKT